MNKQPWIGKPLTDIVAILLPPFASLAVIALFPHLFQNNDNLPEAWWIVLVLLIDVGHVYSTLYRTYFDPYALQSQRFLLWAIPFFAFVAGVLLYTVSTAWFWRLLAYVAVFHFVRQQYGFMRVYSRREPRQGAVSTIDSIAIYSAAVYPLLYWHLKGQRNFNWFIEGDFFYLQEDRLIIPATILYIVILFLYLVKDVVIFLKYRYFNLPKAAIIWGTALSWYFGIVYFNGDLAFTLLNVISHGIPYMALVWLYGRKQYTKPRMGNSFLRVIFSGWGWVLFISIIFVFAFVEEGIWEWAVWQEGRSIFGGRFLPFELSRQALSLLVPLLTLPQLTHYILDGFIWKIKEEDFRWSNRINV